MNHSTRPPLALVLMIGIIWAGCDAEPGFLTPNLPPNTRISAGPPEAKETKYEVQLFWYGWDNDGFVDHYEIAWETPENWIGPIFANDSLFAVQAAESCCVPVLPQDRELALKDSVFQQYHTFYVRAVDNQGVPDESPSFRTFNARTLAPFTNITAGPRNLGLWGTDVVFKWEGQDDDGVAVRYKYALSSFFDYFRDQADTTIDTAVLLSWLDSLTYYPLPGGGYDTDSLVWRETDLDSVSFRNVTRTTDIPPDPDGTPSPLNKNKILFAVRAIDDAGAEEQVLLIRGSDNDNDRTKGNVVIFDVKTRLNGPCLTIVSNVIGSWDCFSQRDYRGVFEAGRGLRFRWSAVPGGSETAISGFAYAVNDTADGWGAFSENTTVYPPDAAPGVRRYWNPNPGRHTLFIAARDEGGFTNSFPVNVQVFGGPTFYTPDETYILVVLDTNYPSLVGVFPETYDQVELVLISYFFDDYVQQVQIHRTRGLNEPDVALLDKASSTFWFLSTDTFQEDEAVLWDYHARPSPNSPANVLPSYVFSGGNLFVCGIQPINAFRYTEDFLTGAADFMEPPFPLYFENTLTDTTLVDHWVTTTIGIAEVGNTVGNSDAIGNPSLYVRRMTSHIRTGPNPYPDLDFDPLSWPEGPISPGFAHYDRGIRVRLLSDPDDPDSVFAAEPIYSVDNTGSVSAVRRLTEPGPNGNVVFAAFHPYFVQKAQFRQFVRAVLVDFGEQED